MVVGFTATYAINAHHHWCCEFEFRSGRGVQHYAIEFVSGLQQGGDFSSSSGFSTNNSTYITPLVFQVVFLMTHTKTYFAKKKHYNWMENRKKFQFWKSVDILLECQFKQTRGYQESVITHRFSIWLLKFVHGKNKLQF